MPGQTGRAFNLAGSLNASKGKPAEQVGFTELPGDITDGVAELIEARRGQYKTGANAGKNFVRFAATVLEPLTAVDTKYGWDPVKKQVIVLGTPRERKVKGLQTSKMYPLCDTKNFDAEANSNAMLNMLKLIAGEEFVNGIDFGTTEASAYKALDAALEELQKTAGIRIRFSTRSRKPSAEYPDSTGVWDHEWLGAVAEDHAGYNGAAAEPASEAEAAAEGVQADDDWDSMVAEYDALDPKEDEHRRDELTEKLLDLAVAAGVDREAASDAENWEVVKAMMDGGGEEAAEEPPFEAEKGVVYSYEVSVPKNPKQPKGPKVKKKLQIETLSVDKKSRTVTAKDCTTKKVLMGADGKKALAIGWDDLIVE